MYSVFGIFFFNWFFRFGFFVRGFFSSTFDGRMSAILAIRSHPKCINKVKAQLQIVLTCFHFCILFRFFYNVYRDGARWEIITSKEKLATKLSSSGTLLSENRYVSRIYIDFHVSIQHTRVVPLEQRIDSHILLRYRRRIPTSSINSLLIVFSI